MFGESGTNYERYPQGSLFVDGTGHYMMAAYHYLRFEWRHGANPPLQTMFGYGPCLGLIGESESGNGIANVLMADFSVTTTTVGNRRQFM